MKTKLLFFTIINSFFCFSQSNYTFKSGGRIFENQTKIKPDQIRTLLINDSEALNLYEVGRTKKTVGNLLYITGAATIVGKLIYDVTRPLKTEITGYDYFGNPKINVDSKKSKTLYFVGASLVVIAIPVKAGFSKKIRKAVDLMNENVKNPKNSFHIESTSIISNSDGVGISIKF